MIDGLIQDAAVACQVRYGLNAVETVTACADKLQCSRSDKAAVYAVALHATIVELFAGCLALAQTDRAAGIPFLVRGIFEAFVDLHNLLRDSTHYRRMEAANLEQMLKLLDQAPTNPMLAGLGDLRDIERYRTEYAAELAALRSSRSGALDLASRSKLVGLEAQYRAMYTLHCLDSHNNLAALAERHLEFGSDGEVTAISFFVGDDAESTQARLDLAASFFIDAAGAIHSAFKTGAREIEALQAAYPGEHARVVSEVNARAAARRRARPGA